jgi:hypothetical protein
MAGQQKAQNRIVVVNDIHANPQTSDEWDASMKQVAGALQGSWGKGSWDGGIGGEGYWIKHSMFWDATVKATLKGVTTFITPFPCKDAIAKVSTIDPTTGNVSTSNLFIESGFNFNVTFIGVVIVEFTNVQNVRS